MEKKQTFHVESILTLISLIVVFLAPTSSKADAFTLLWTEGLLGVFLMTFAYMALDYANLRKMNMIGLLEFIIFVVAGNIIGVTRAAVVFARHFLGNKNYILVGVTVLVLLVLLNEFRIWINDCLVRSKMEDK